MATRRVTGSFGINVEGLRELDRALAKTAPDLRDAIKKANREVADDVTQDAKANAAGVSKLTAKTAPNLRAVGSARYAGVSLGGPTAPYALGAEFGGGRRKTTKQFAPWRGSGPGAGYFLYPAIAENAPRILGTYFDNLDDILDRNGL